MTRILNIRKGLLIHLLLAEQKAITSNQKEDLLFEGKSRRITMDANGAPQFSRESLHELLKSVLIEISKEAQKYQHLFNIISCHFFSNPSYI
jgi:ribosomal protein L9